MNTHNKHYQQLTQEQRYQISGLRKAGMSTRAISQEVGVHFSTISRELLRNQTADCYDPSQAHRICEERRRTAFKANKFSEKSDTFIKTSLTMGWSPETLSKRLKLEVATDEQLSHSTIYRRISKVKSKVENCIESFLVLERDDVKVGNGIRRLELG